MLNCFGLRKASQTLFGRRGQHPPQGATYPLEVYVVVGNNSVVGLKEGVYHYDPHTHSIEKVREGDIREELCDAAVGQEWVKNAPVDFVICAIYERTTQRYSERGIRYVHMEAGHAAQNMYLQCESLGLGWSSWVLSGTSVFKNCLTQPQNHFTLFPWGILSSKKKRKRARIKTKRLRKKDKGVSENRGG